MVYALTQQKERGIMPIYGTTPGPISWKGDQSSSISNWNAQAGTMVNNQTADQSRLTLPVKSGRWNASRRDW